MERWTYLIIAGADGAAIQMRIFLRNGDDESAWPVVQVSLDGTEVPVDDVVHDYEAPEWKAAQSLAGGQARLDQLKDHLRETARA
jgi:hypothetical protein